MKKVVAMMLMLTMCVSMWISTGAAEADFTPSITYKGEPEIVEKEDEQGQVIIGEVLVTNNNETEHQSYVKEACLLITSVAKLDEQKDLPEEAAQTLRMVYEELLEGDMKLPYEKVEGIVPEDMVILELLDITWCCSLGTTNCDHKTELEAVNTMFEITFDLGVAADAKVTVMTYKNDEWNPILKATNNGDGTVTCLFEHLCPVAISVEQADKDAAEAPETGDNANMNLWMGVMAAALVSLFVLVLVYRRFAAKTR